VWVCLTKITVNMYKFNSQDNAHRERELAIDHTHVFTDITKH